MLVLVEVFDALLAGASPRAPIMFPERRAKAWLARGGQSAIEDDEALPRLSTLPRASTPTTLVRFFLPAADPLTSQPHHMHQASHRSMHRRRRRRGSPPTLLRAILSRGLSFRSCAMPTHHTPTEFDAKGSSGQSAWAGMMPDAAAAPPTPSNRAKSKWQGWSK